MNSTISKFLKQFYVDGVFFTHVSLIQPKGKFQLNRGKVEEFWELYCKETNEKDELIIGVAEKIQNNLPVLVDIDIKIKESDNIDFGEHLYTEKQVIQVIEIYQSVLRNIVEECTDAQLMCILLEKPIYSVTNNNVKFYKNGFHLHFPSLFLSKQDQEIHLFPRVKEEIKKANIFESLGFTDSSKTVDECTCRNPWLLYGSRKSEQHPPYFVTKFFDSQVKEISIEEAFKNYELFDTNEELIDIKGKEKYYLPRILSIIPYGRASQELKYGLPSPIKGSINNKISNKIEKKELKVSVSDALKLSERLLPLLSTKRAEDYYQWMEIGWVLFNISEGCEEGLEQWLEFSARAEDKYDEAKCIAEWGKMVAKKYTIGTLKHYAQVDSPDLFAKFKSEISEKYLTNALDGSHHDIAKLLYEEYGTEFVCSSIAGKTWFQFREHKWEEIEEGVFLRDKISKEIVDLYSKKGGDYFNKLAQTNDKAAQDKINQTRKIMINLKTSPFKNSVMRECCDVFYNKNFKNELDTNPYLICFNNGVYDLKLNVFRNGKPEDYLSKSMPIGYYEFCDTDDRVTAVYDFLEKVFPDKSVRQYFLDQASDVFVGGNHQKVVIFWTGEGDNGKSVTQNIFEKMLGQLAIKFSTTLITGKKTANGAANPELARAGGGVRWAILEEPDGDEEINIGYLKSLSGNDSYFARDLFEKGKQTKEMTPMFKLTFICNKLPTLRHSDKATWNRIRVIPFESTFVRPNEPCPESYEEQLREKRFPMDTEFSKKIPELLEPFAYILLQHRKNLKTRVEPEKVRIATETYRKQNDSYRQFVDECIMTAPNSILTLIEIYQQFKDWFKEGFPGQSLPVKNQVKEYFIKLWGEPDNLKWRGYRIKTIDDEIETGVALVLNDEDLVDYDTVPKGNFTPDF